MDALPLAPQLQVGKKAHRMNASGRTGLEHGEFSAVAIEVRFGTVSKASASACNRKQH